MYDWSEVAEATRALETALTDEICASLSIAPSKLLAWELEGDLYDLWTDPGLLLGQTCGYPLTHGLKDKVAVVGAPNYDAKGCSGSDYCSQIIVPADSPFESVADLKGSRAVFNGLDSQSGMNALRHSIAPYANGGAFFQSVEISGGHLASMTAVSDGKADVAAIDAVCWALAQQEKPDLVAGLRCLAETARAPCLPYITSSQFGLDVKAVIAEAVQRVFSSSQTQKCRERLRIRGFSELDEDNYAVIINMEAEARALGYSALV